MRNSTVYTEPKCIFFDCALIAQTESIQKWKKDGKRAVWLRVPVVQSYLIPEAFAHGFTYHHAFEDYAMLLKWLPSNMQCKVPAYATHQVGVAGRNAVHIYIYIRGEGEDK